MLSSNAKREARTHSTKSLGFARHGFSFRIDLARPVMTRRAPIDRSCVAEGLSKWYGGSSAAATSRFDL